MLDSTKQLVGSELHHIAGDLSNACPGATWNDALDIFFDAFNSDIPAEDRDELRVEYSVQGQIA